MPTHVALLRGINVGGANRVAMAQLRDVVAGLGHADVATYIQSGNVVFTAGRKDRRRLAADLEAAIADRLDVRPVVVVLTRDDLAEAVAANPFPDEPNPRLVHAVFRSQDLTADDVAAVEQARRRAAERGSVDRVSVVGRTLYLHTPGGLGRSELAEQLNRTRVNAAGTARNWATVGKLLAMCDT